MPNDITKVYICQHRAVEMRQDTSDNIKNDLLIVRCKDCEAEITAIISKVEIV